MCQMAGFFVLMICITPLYTYFEGGNLTEEYALPFIAAALYIYFLIILSMEMFP